MLILNKKSVMFGVEARALKKQSGGLFLARLRRLTFRLVEGHQSSQMLTAKGVMFGVDARVTLAIFAIISIVVGANVLGILYDVNVKKIVIESRTIGSAVEQYHKDINKSIFDTINPALVPDAKEKAVFKALFRNENISSPNDTKWGGPYLKVKYKDGIEPDLGKYYRLVRLSESLSTTCNNTKNNPCYVFLKFKDLDTEICDVFKEATETDAYSKVHEDTSGSDCHILINIGLDY